jgi:serine/threonine protein phosphatase PrpC
MTDSTLILALGVVAASLALAAVVALRMAGRRAPPPAPKRQAPPPVVPDSLADLPESWDIPSFVVEEDDDLELTKVQLLDHGEATRPRPRHGEVVPIIYDDDAAVDVPTSSRAFILVSAIGQTDRGVRRRKNEDSFLILDEPPLFMVADGMGGYAGGEVASRLAVDVVKNVFLRGEFDARYRELPRRGSEVAQAVQAANEHIYARAHEVRELREMGTTMVCARFSTNKQRVYIGHVGDSRCYVLRKGKLHQITRDHTAAAEGITGPMGATLTRALGISRAVVVDLIIGKPHPGDVYMLCSDGLSKMVKDPRIAEILTANENPADAVRELIEQANASGGRDNVTVILVCVERPPEPFRAAVS